MEISKKMNLAPPCTDRAHFTRTVHMCTDRANLHGPCKSFLETDPIRAELAVCGEELLRHPKEREKGRFSRHKTGEAAARVPELREADFGRIGAGFWCFEAACTFYASEQRGR